jgi:hypothetical protein
MTDPQRMALWATFNALLASRKQPPLADIEAARIWWRRYEAELSTERAYKRADDDYRAGRTATHAWD